MAAPLQQDPDLPGDIQPLFDAYPQVLADKMRAVVDKASQLKAQRKRVLIVVREDATATQVITTLKINSYQVVTAWPRPVIKGFNKGTTDAIEVLITTFKAINIQERHFRGRCHQGIMLETPDSVEEHSLIRNVWFLGAESCDWEVQYVPGSLDSWRDVTAAKRKVTTMMADETVYPELRGFVHQRRIVCFYDVALTMQMVESHYPRARVHWSKMEAIEIKREALFYFAFGKFLKQNLDAASKISDDQSKMCRIAKS
ncbi:DEAD-like helicase [Fusarium coicis]|nr:DEAD-like helicase [Fusarium coicis]